MKKRFTRLTALLLALLMLMSMAYAESDASVTKGQYDTSLTQMIDDLSLIPTEMETPEVKTIEVDTTTLVPTYEAGEGVVTPADSITVTAKTAPEDVGGYQWMIKVGDVWAKIDGATEQTLNLTYAMAKPAMDATGKVLLRCRLIPAVQTYAEGEAEAVYEDEITYTVNDAVEYVRQDEEEPMKIKVTEYMENETPGEDYYKAWDFQNAAKTPAVSTYGLMTAAEDDERTTYNLVITYKLNGKDVASPYPATLAKGSPFSATVQHPAVQGYQPTQGNADGWKVEGITYTNTETQINLTNIQQDINLLVTYQPAEVKYTVVHYQQNLENDGYTPVLTETKWGLTESTVPEVAKIYKNDAGETVYTEGYEGFYPLLYEKPQIAADGTTVVEVYYDRNYYLMLFDLDGGYGVEPIYAKYGAKIGDGEGKNDSVGIVKREGYTFQNWTLEGKDATIPTTMPAKNSTYKAKWKMNEEANVTLVFWGENADDTGYSPLPSKTVTTKPGTEFTYDENGSLICGKEAHTHSADCGYDCGYDEHSHSLADNCYTLTCTQTSHNHVNDGCTLDCKHEHDLSCYSAAYGKLVESSRPNQTLTDRGNGIYTYTTTVLWETVTHYYVNIGDKWYCSDSRLGDVITISLNCSHSHGDECYTCGQKNSTHVHTIDGGCYELDCQIPPHSHTVDCYACGKAEHSHSSGCYMAGAGLDSNLWVFEKSDTVTVAADGSSVVNVYYKRTTKTLTFKYNYSNKAYQKTQTITAKWGEDISVEYVAIADDCGSTFWSAETDGSGPYTNYFGIMPQTSATYYHRSANGSNGSMMYYGQDLTGDYNVKLFQVDNVGGYKVTVEDRYEFEGFTYHHGTSTGSSCSGATFYYTRNVYDIEFYNPTEQIGKVEDVYYEAPLGDYDFTPIPDQAPDSYEPGSVEFEGWYLNPECTGEKYILANHTMPVGAVNGEVALTLYAKWKPVNRTVSFYLDRTKYDAKEKLTSHPDVTVPHGSKVEPIPATPTKGDYTFVGWFYEEDGVEKAFDFKNMPVTENLKVYGKWSSNVLKEYSVYFKIKTKDANGNEIEIDIAEPIIGSTLAGQTKTFDAKGGTDLYTDYQEGYFPLVESHSITLDIEDDSKNTFTFYYVQKDAVPYTVYYVAETLKDGENPDDYIATDKTIVRDGKTYYIIADTYTNSENRQAVVTEQFKVVSGYMPDAYQKRLVVNGTDGAVNEIIFYYSVDKDHAYYKITHYTQELDGSWTEYASSQAIGDIGKPYTANPMDISGFTYSKTEYEVNDKVTTNNTLTAGGLEINLYYTRNSYPYVVHYLEQGTGKKLAEPKNGTGLYQDTIGESAINITNYTAVDPTYQTLTIKKEESLNVITFYYVENYVPITYKVVGPTGCGTVDIIDGTEKKVTEDSENVKILTGTALGAKAAANTPTYKFVGWFMDEACTLPVDASWVTNSSIAGAEIKPKMVDGENVKATYYAKFDWHVGQLKISKTGMVNDETAIFTVTVGGDEYKVVLNKDNNYTVTLVNLIHDSAYSVVEDDSWSWTYKQGTVTNATGKIVAGSTIEATVENSKDEQWLYDEQSITNFKN